MSRPRASHLRRYVQPLDFDPSPLYACELTQPTAEGVREVRHWMAFDPRYGPTSQGQIDWHINHNTPGAETWEIGVACQ